MFPADFSGASHLDDIFYLFKSIYADLPGIDSKEFKLVKVMVDLWTSFATSGTPETFEGEINWNEMKKSDDEPKVLNIGTEVEEISMITMPEYEKLKVWNEIYQDANVDLF
jgi:carboxylesterase type B